MPNAGSLFLSRKYYAIFGHRINAMMENLKIDHTAGVVTIAISRPEALNALNLKTLSELITVLQQTYEQRDYKGIILTGDGEKAFVAGADIKELSALTQEQARAFAQNGQRLFKLIEDCPKPVIAAVNGYALGGGCELAMACHIRIASEDAKFGQPEVNLGIIPGYGGTQRLPQLVGRGKALEIMLTGDMITAEEAKQIGLVNHVVPQDQLMSAAGKMMSRILSKGPVAVANVIKSVNAGFQFEGAGYQAEAENFAVCTTTSDFKEGTDAIIEKRQPHFKGE
jgi:enoyl-CoA hydratase